ncbi:GlxA family transcriptional regulator [Paraburkholderia youngii]|uniref:GlxA family transcriptional regulator n=1 Tax=Paraburkholderia youngii TaxID=2782701 RepID=UPI003D239DA0
MQLARSLYRNRFSTIEPDITGVEIVLFDGFSLPTIAAISEILQRANELVQKKANGKNRYEVSLLSSSGGKITSSSAVHVWTEKASSNRATSSTTLLFIAGGAGAQGAASDDRLSGWVRARHATSDIVYPISEGKLILDAVGLTGRYIRPTDEEGATHHNLGHHKPKHRISAIQTVLQVVKEDLGIEMAKHVGHRFISFEAEPGDAALPRSPATRRISDKILASARWIDANLDHPISIKMAADGAAMSERNFLRRFKAEIGLTPSDYLQHARLKLSCHMLIESQLPVDKIARRCGFGGGAQLAKRFKKHLATTPTQYRLKHASRGISVRASEFEPESPSRLAEMEIPNEVE